MRGILIDAITTNYIPYMILICLTIITVIVTYFLTGRSKLAVILYLIYDLTVIAIYTMALIMIRLP